MKVASRWASVFLIWVATSLLVSPLLVFPLVDGASLYDNQRLVEISCALFALAIFVGKWLSEAPRPVMLNRPIAGLLAVFFGLGLLSSGVAYSPRHALFEWANLLLLLVMAWVVAVEVKARGEALLDKLLLAGGIACAVYLLLETLIYVSLLRTGIQPSPRQLIVGYNNYRFFNHVQTISLPLLALLAARIGGRDRRAFWWGLVALWWMLLFVGLGRGTLVGMAAGIAITWLLLRRSAVPWCRAMAWAGLAGLAAYLFLYALIPVLMGMEPFGLLFSGAERSVENPTSGRISLWIRALEMMQANPWLGAGPAHFAHYGRDLPNGNAHPHNWMLQFGSEWGALALLALAGAVVLAMRRLWQLRGVIASQDQDTLTAWLVTGGAILVDGMVSGLIVAPTSQLWIALYIGCAWGWAASRLPSRRAARPRLPIAGRLVAVLLAPLTMYAVLNGIWPDLRDQGVGKTVHSKDVVYSPRILLEGRF